MVSKRDHLNVFSEEDSLKKRLADGTPTFELSGDVDVT